MPMNWSETTSVEAPLLLLLLFDSAPPPPPPPLAGAAAMGLEGAGRSMSVSPPSTAATPGKAGRPEAAAAAAAAAPAPLTPTAVTLAAMPPPPAETALSREMTSRVGERDGVPHKECRLPQ